MLLTTKKSLIIALTLSLVAGGAFGGAWYAVFYYKQIVKQRGATALLASKKETDVLELKKTLEDTEEDRSKLRQFIIGDDDVANFLELVENTARGQGLQVATKAVTVEPIKDTALFEQLSLTLEVEGEYQGVASMISLLETLPYQVSITSVALERTSLKGDVAPQVWRGRFMMKVTKEKKI